MIKKLINPENYMVEFVTQQVAKSPNGERRLPRLRDIANQAFYRL